jgi:tetratricopeptide (TPR) repeat protein
MLAILRFENLSPDSSLDWMSRGMAEALSLQLANSARYQLLPVAAAVPAQATHAAYGRFSTWNGRLRAVLAIEDLSSRKRVATVSASGSSLADAASGLARQLDPAATTVRLPAPEALRAYAEGVETRDPETATALLDRAIAADPGFSKPYLAALQLAKARGDRAAMERYVAAGAAKAHLMNDRDRAALAYESAVLRGDRDAEMRALADIARAGRGDPDQWRALAQLEVAAGKYGDAAAHLRRAAALAPSDIAVLNELGYALAYAGRFDEAVDALRRYERLRPAEANPLDSIGDVHFYFKRYAEAGRLYEEAQKREPAFLNGASDWKAALAWRTAGDRARADAAVDRLRGRRLPSADVAIWLGQWDALNGNLQDALRRFETAGTLGRGFAVVAALDANQRDLAQKYAEGAAPVAAVLCAPDWEKRVAQLPESVRPALTGYALMFSGRFEEAAKAFDAERRTIGGAEQARAAILAAWCLRKAGGQPDPSLTQYAPAPHVQPPSPFTAAIYARLAELARKSR